MAAPRPFGTGPYGVGYYSRYRGNLYEVGGACLLNFGAAARPNRISSISAVSSITFDAEAWGANRIMGLIGSTGITWDVTAHGIIRIIRPWAFSQIIFDMWSEHLEDTWITRDPCVAGAWQPEACTEGAWVVSEPCGAAGWSNRLEATGGAWDTSEPCSIGVWGKA